MKKVAIITGASSGMGREFACMIDKKFHSIDEIWLIARRRERLEELREEINKPCLIVCEDVTEEGFKERFQKMLKQEQPMIKLLVNCAGYGIIGSVERSAPDVILGMVDTNCRGLSAVTITSLPYMAENSRIINIASSSAFLPQPYFAVYAATKSYVLSFSRGLNYELKKRDIHVTAVCPGPVATEFFRIAEDGQRRAWFKDFFMSNPKDVVETAIEDAINKKELSIYGTSMKLFYLLTKLVPHRIILKIYTMFTRQDAE